MGRKNKRFFLKDSLGSSKPIYVFALLVFVTGIILGAIMVNTLPHATSSELSGYLGNFFDNSKESDKLGFGQVFKAAVCNNAKYIVLATAASVTFATSVLSVLLLGFKGFSVGFTVGFMIKNFAFKGVFFSMASILPSMIVIIPVYALIYRNSVRYAYNNFKNRDNMTFKEKRNEFLIFLLSVAVLFGILCASSALDSFFTPVIIKYIF